LLSGIIVSQNFTRFRILASHNLLTLFRYAPRLDASPLNESLYIGYINRHRMNYNLSNKRRQTKFPLLLLLVQHSLSLSLSRLHRGNHDSLVSLEPSLNLKTQDYPSLLQSPVEILDRSSFANDSIPLHLLCCYRSCESTTRRPTLHTIDHLASEVLKMLSEVSWLEKFPAHVDLLLLDLHSTFEYSSG